MKTRFAIALAILSSFTTASLSRAQNVPDTATRYDRCNAALVQTIDYTKLTEMDFLSYMSQVNETTWNQKKQDASFVGKIFYYFPMSAEANYSQFSEARRAYFQKINYDSRSERFFETMRAYLTDAQLQSWSDCMKGNGIFISARQVTATHLTLSVYWFPPPGLTQDVPIEGTLAGGRAVFDGAKDGQLFKAETMIKANSETSVVIQRDHYTPISVAVNIGGFTDTYSYGSTLTQRIDELEAQLKRLQSKVAIFEAAFPPADPKAQAERVVAGHDDGSVTFTCPPGTYVHGLIFSFNKGSKHGIVNGVSPLIKPFFPQPESKPK